MASKVAKMVAAARQRAGGHAGPHGSFPITGAKSVKSAYSLAFHAANPPVVRANIVKIAKRKGLTSALPATAKAKRKNS